VPAPSVRNRLPLQTSRGFAGLSRHRAPAAAVGSIAVSTSSPSRRQLKPATAHRKVGLVPAGLRVFRSPGSPTAESRRHHASPCRALTPPGSGNAEDRSGAVLGSVHSRYAMTRCGCGRGQTRHEHQDSGELSTQKTQLPFTIEPEALCGAASSAKTLDAEQLEQFLINQIHIVQLPFLGSTKT
jgi:hypothetical protein